MEKLRYVCIITGVLWNNRQQAEVNSNYLGFTSFGQQ